MEGRIWTQSLGRSCRPGSGRESGSPWRRTDGPRGICSNNKYFSSLACFSNKLTQVAFAFIFVFSYRNSLAFLCDPLEIEQRTLKVLLPYYVISSEVVFYVSFFLSVCLQLSIKSFNLCISLLVFVWIILGISPHTT